MNNVKQNKFKVSKISAKFYKRATGLTVDRDKVVEHKNAKQDSQPIQQFQEYYNNITREDQRIAMTSNETIKDINFSL